MTLFSRKNRQISLAMLCFFLIATCISAQLDTTKIDYAKRSNILNPDTLQGDNLAIFKCFVKLSSEEAENLDPMIIKEEFAEIGITIKENDRFVDALTFYDITMKYHKISCEQWESFKDLAPK